MRKPHCNHRHRDGVLCGVGSSAAFSADTVLLAVLHLSLSVTSCRGDSPVPYSIFDGSSSCIRPLGMKRRVHHQPPPCKQRPPRSIMDYIYPCGMVISSLSPLALCSLSLLSLAWRGAGANAIRIGSVVVVAVAVVVDIHSRHGRAGPSTEPGADQQKLAQQTE